MKQSVQDQLAASSLGARILRAVPVALAVLIAVYLLHGAYKVTQPQELTRFDFDTFGKVPVSEDGRVKPLDTVARNALLMLSQKQSLIDDMLLPSEGSGDKPAIVWLAEVISRRPEAFTRKVIRIDDPGIVALMGKTPEDGKYFSLDDLSKPAKDSDEPVHKEIQRLASAANEVRDDQRTKFQEHLIGLWRQMGVLDELLSARGPFVIPPVEAGQDWAPLVDDPRVGLNLSVIDRAPAKSWMKMVEALSKDNPEAFNAALAEHLELKQTLVPGQTRKAAFEQAYNRYAPFAKGVALYILAGLLGLLAMLLRPILPKAGYTALWRSGMGVLLVVFVLHTAALIIRIWLQGRPPVTNLYSSAVFIGWGIVGGAIILEKITKLGVASLAASSAGVATLIIAHHLSKDGDTMGVMQAVLDSNFWLGTHVITITLGYSATFLAGFIALCYILFGMVTPLLDRKMGRAMAGMVYAVICFALLFSFVGTVLGGIWADQSWGRFWGWDPKENGAILIVLMNAIILHARWGHLIKERGLMVLALGGNIITAWSWFGTNLLGVGLHSYGFMDGAMLTLMIVVANHMLIMAAALILPTHLWYTNYRLKHPPLLPPMQQVLVGSGLLIAGLVTTLAMLWMTVQGTMDLNYWYAGWLLLFVAAAGLGQLIEGTRLYLADPSAKGRAAAATA